MKNIIRLVHIRNIGLVLCFCIGIMLLFSVGYSGYRYLYDSDEVMHVHMIYLLSYGYKIFSDFFSIHAPLFHYLLLPVFAWTGRTWESFSVLRLVMVVLYGLRLWVGWLFVSKLFSRSVAWIFLVVMLVDPFAVFAGMQIRPDSLMMLVFFMALLVSFEAYRKQSKRLWFAGGFLVSLSVLVSLKISVSAASLSFLLFVYFFFKKRIGHFIVFCAGILISLILFCLLFVIQGSFGEMLRQLLFDSKAMSDALWYPTRLGFFYAPDNTFIYGLPGKPIVWYIACFLPILAIGGILYALLRWRKTHTKRFWIIVFALMLGAQYAFLSTVKSMFIQYYLTVNWILCLFASVFLHAFFTGIKKPTWLATALSMGAVILFIVVSVGSIKANMSRGTMIFSDNEKQRMVRRWEIIPKNASVYPFLLFRPLSQPIPCGHFLPEVPLSIRSRYPSDLSTIQNRNLRYLILTSYNLKFIDGETQNYITDHFTQQADDEELWVRNTL